MFKTLTQLAVLVSTVASLGACERRPGTDGPLGSGGDKLTLCTPGEIGQRFLHGGDVLSNQGQDIATVDEVRLVGAEGVTMLDAFLVPIHNTTLIGTGSPIPPTSLGWPDRIDASGAELPPVTGDGGMELVMLLEPTAEKPRVADVEVSYSVGRKSYTHLTNTALLVETVKPTCELGTF